MKAAEGPKETIVCIIDILYCTGIIILHTTRSVFNQAFETDISSFFLGLNQRYLQFRNDLLQLIYRQESSFPLRFSEVVPRRQEIILHIDDQTRRLGQGQRVCFLHFQTVKGYSKFSKCMSLKIPSSYMYVYF